MIAPEKIEEGILKALRSYAQRCVPGFMSDPAQSQNADLGYSALKDILSRKNVPASAFDAKGGKEPVLTYLCDDESAIDAALDRLASGNAPAIQCIEKTRGRRTTKSYVITQAGLARLEEKPVPALQIPEVISSSTGRTVA